LVDRCKLPKTVSARIENELHQQLIDRCNQVGCRVSDFIKASIEFSLYGSIEFDFGRSREEEEEEEKENGPEQKPEDRPTQQRRIYYLGKS
jgi:hypothetical protein